MLAIHNQDRVLTLRRVRLTLCVLMTALTLQFARVHASSVVQAGGLPDTAKDGAMHPGPSSLGAMPRIGVNTGDQMDAPALDNAGASGARMARISVYWNSIEPAYTDTLHYNWASMDSIFLRI